MQTGTSYFVSEPAAIKYYRGYESGNPAERTALAKRAVARKIADGEIHIGQPALKPGQRLTVIDDGCRYAINESLYSMLLAAGIEVSNHESDLYFPVTTESARILSYFPLEKGNSSLFKHQGNGDMWYDVPFAFIPFWAGKEVK